MKRALTLEQHIAAGLAKAQEVGDCLEWQGYMTNHGTQPAIKMRLEGRKYTSNIPVPRLLWEQANGPLEPGKLVYRKCCNNACICLDHIAVGTRADWAKARKKAGATKHSPSTRMTLTIAARSRANVKYSMEIAREVRQLAASGMLQIEVAKLTGVSKDMVTDICNNKSWREYSSPFAGLGAR